MPHATLITIAACLTASATLALGPLSNGISDRLGLVPDDILISFNERDIAKRWITVNDNVMGGRSIGGFEVADGRLVFSGSTNTNGGGFSSIRTRSTDLNLDGKDGMLYRVRGDGRSYIAGLRTGAKFGSFDISYWSTFQTAGDGTWQTVRIPFSDFYPTMFGENISGRAPELRAQDIAGAEIYIYDKKDGPFELAIEWIGSYTDMPEVQIAEAPKSEASTTGNLNNVAGLTSTSETRASSAESQNIAQMAAARTWANNVLAIAIERGVPQFNEGNKGACADIYEVAIASLVMNPSMLPGDAVALLQSGLRAAKQARSHTDRAWAYRYAMDAAMGVLAEHSGTVSMDPTMSVRAD